METILQRLTEFDEIRNAVLVGRDGLIVASVMQNDDEEVIGAMSAAAFGSIANFIGKIRGGETHHVIVETKNGTVQMEVAGDLLLIVTTNGTNNLGRIRMEMKKASRQLAQLVASY